MKDVFYDILNEESYNHESIITEGKFMKKIGKAIFSGDKVKKYIEYDFVSYSPRILYDKVMSNKAVKELIDCVIKGDMEKMLKNPYDREVYTNVILEALGESRGPVTVNTVYGKYIKSYVEKDITDDLYEEAKDDLMNILPKLKDEAKEYTDKIVDEGNDLVKVFQEKFKKYMYSEKDKYESCCMFMNFFVYTLQDILYVIGAFNACVDAKQQIDEEIIKKYNKYIKEDVFINVFNDTNI